MNNEVVYHHPNFKSLAGRNLMEYTFHDAEVCGYQLEMITNNQIPGMLKNEVIRIDGEIRLSFDITSLIPIKKLFERREIGRKDFFYLLKQVITLLEQLEEYLLDSGGIIFDSQFIFVNPQNLTMEFAYVPVKEMSQDLEPLKVLLLDAIIHDVRFANEPSDNFIQKFIELLKTQELKISTLKTYVNNMEAVMFPAAAISINEVSYQGISPQEALAPEQKIKIPNKIQSTYPVKQQESLNTSKMCFPTKSYIILGSVVAAFIIFGVTLSFTETLSVDNPDFLLSLFGYLMIGGALTYLVYSKLFTSDKRIQKSSAPLPNQSITPKIESRPIQVQHKKTEYVNKNFVIPELIQKAKNEAAPGMQTRLFPLDQQVKNQDRTVILDGNSLKHPFLKGFQGDSETIILTHFPFMLGRLQEQVDYCLKNPAIGKLHAEIKKTPQGYFVTDMNTRNSTLINGQRLEPSQDYKLENGAHITFANEEFIFCE